MTRMTNNKKMFSSRLYSSDSCPTMNPHGKGNDDELNIKIHPSSCIATNNNSSSSTTCQNDHSNNNLLLDDGSNNKHSSPSNNFSSTKTTSVRRLSTDDSLSASMVALSMNTPKNLDSKTQRRQSSSSASSLTSNSTHSDSILSLFKSMGKSLSPTSSNNQDHNSPKNTGNNQLSSPSSGSSRPSFSSQSNSMNSPARKNYFNFDETKYENSCRKAIEAGKAILKIILKNAKDKKLATSQLYYYVEIEIFQSSKRTCLKSCVKQGEETMTWNEEFHVSISPSVEETFSVSLWSLAHKISTDNGMFDICNFFVWF